MEAFDDNMRDAELLVSYARAFKDRRSRNMRSERRDAIGEALDIPIKDRSEIDRIESDDLFVVLKPGSNLKRDDFVDVRPLLRQAWVAACAALETYVADIVVEYVGYALRSNNPPQRLLDISLTMGQWLQGGKSSGWIQRDIVVEHLRHESSTAHNKIGLVLSTVGIEKWSTKVEKQLGVKKDWLKSNLERITTRRNKIAHTGDKQGRGRAKIDVEEVEEELKNIRCVVEAIGKVLENHKI